MGLRDRIEIIKGTVTTPAGFLADGVACGIKKTGKKDLAVVFSACPASAAGVFTKNKFCAAPVQFTKSIIRRGRLQAVVINSGNANACTGTRGYKDSVSTAEAFGKLFGIPSDTVGVCSTGVIGVFLPMQKILHGLKTVQLSRHKGRDAAQAILTTDNFKKERAARFSIGNSEVTVGGIAKGAGMIHPDMATMISVITTDIRIAPKLLKEALLEATRKSFNAMTVDGDESTNDTVLVLANGVAQNREIRKKDGNYKIFVEALTLVAEELAKDIVRDGEGSTKLVRVCVEKASSAVSAKRFAEAVSRSNLVKTALYGEDPNWGRIVAAIGSVKLPVDPGKIDIYFGPEKIVSRGIENPVNQRRAKRIMRKDEFDIRIILNQGKQSFAMWTCDLTHEYIRINASYRS